MNMDILKKMKVVDLKNIIRNYKKTNCPPYSSLKKLELINLIIKLKIPQSSNQSSSSNQSETRSSSLQSGIIDKKLKEELLKLVAKKIASKKKQFEKAPAQTAIERRDRTGKREKINQKIDELLDIQKYLNAIYRDNITEKVDKRKIKILLK
tara:strand:+ start:27 stop:482 length:456 start_codon:yes stop_codon:yes gene_type:complete